MANRKKIFCIFIDTICEGWIPAWHDEQGMPVVFSTLDAAQCEIADDMVEYGTSFSQAGAHS